MAAIGVGGAGAVLAACAGTDNARSSGSPLGSTTPAVSSGEASSGEPLIMIIRHAEKPASSDRANGVTVDGAKDKNSLTVTGWTRAGALVGLFGADGQPPREGLATPSRVIASVGGSESSHRPLETITPLAQRLGIAPNTQFTKDDTSAAADFARRQTGVTLMSWEHKRIRDLVRAFGQVTPEPRDWPDDRFDMVWLLRPAGSGWALTEVAQMLLHGDGLI